MYALRGTLGRWGQPRMIATWRNGISRALTTVPRAPMLGRLAGPSAGRWRHAAATPVRRGLLGRCAAHTRVELARRRLVCTAAPPKREDELAPPEARDPRIWPLSATMMQTTQWLSLATFGKYPKGRFWRKSGGSWMKCQVLMKHWQEYFPHRILDAPTP